MAKESPSVTAHPHPLQVGDKIRFISPASTPKREDVEETATLLRSWGFEVDFGDNTFRRLNYLAGTDEERLADINKAFRDPSVRAIFATRGGKGCYCIADGLDFAAARCDPKFLVGFSDITILHLALEKHGVGGSIHGALSIKGRKGSRSDCSTLLKELLTNSDDVILNSKLEEETSKLTTVGRVEGIMVGGNLDMVATAAGWALPSLENKILLLEAFGMYLGQVDRQLTMLRKGGHLNGVVGIALGQFTDFQPSGSLTIIDLLRDHLSISNIPILGGLPLGHGQTVECIPLGYLTSLDCDNSKLTIYRNR